MAVGTKPLELRIQFPRRLCDISKKLFMIGLERALLCSLIGGLSGDEGVFEPRLRSLVRCGDACELQQLIDLFLGRDFILPHMLLFSPLVSLQSFAIGPLSMIRRSAFAAFPC